MIGRLLRRLGRYLRSFVPSEGEKRFVEVNGGFWKRYWPTRDIREARPYVLIEVSENPIINLCNASFGSIVCHARNVQPLYLLSGFRDRSTRRILQSYHPDSRFITTASPRYVLAWFWTFILAWRAWMQLRTPRDILEFRIDGIKFGDIIYDNTLVRGYATLKKVDVEVLSVLHNFFRHRYVINDIIRRYPLDSFVVAHTIGMFGGMTYENPRIQESIDEVFVSQQKKNVALAEFEAQEKMNERMLLAAKADAEQVTLKATAEAQRRTTEAEAEAHAIEMVSQSLKDSSPAFIQIRVLEAQQKQIDRWDGRFPTTFIGGLSQPNLLLNVPPPAGQ